MLKIGEFARLSQVSLKTLRHYDTLDILRPSHIDPETGYRLYELEQLADMMRIMALKDCGFSLDEIAQLLRSHDVKAIEALLNERVTAQQQIVAEEQARLQRLVARVKQATHADETLLYDVALKRTEPLTLVGLRQCVTTRDDIGPLAHTVLQQFQQQALVPIGPLIHIYFDVQISSERIDLFVGAPMMALPSAISGLSCERLPGGEQVACVLHRGDYTEINSAYVALHRWLATSGYYLSGPCREIYHRSSLQTTDAASYLTEIQLPILAAHE